MQPAVGTILNLTVDTRWTAGRLRWSAKDGSDTQEYELPFIGWATVVGWNSAGDDDQPEDFEAELSAVFLAEGKHAWTLLDINRFSEGFTEIVRLIPANDS